MAILNTYLGRSACLWLATTGAVGCGGDGQSNNANPTLGGQQAVAGGGATARNEPLSGGTAGASSSATTSAGGGSLSTTSINDPTQAGSAGAPPLNAAGGLGGSTTGSTTSEVNAAGSHSAGASSILPTAGGVAGNTLNGAAGWTTGGTTALPNEAGGTSGVGGRTNGAGGSGGVEVSTGGIAGATDGTGGTETTGTGGAPAIPNCFPASLSKPNVVVLHDASPSGADVEGALWVGGDATFTGYSVGTKLSIGNCEDVSLIVGGVLSGSVNYGRCGFSRHFPSDFATIAHDVKALSAALQLLPQEGSVQTIGGLTLTGGSETLNVFNVSASQLTSSGTIVINVPIASTVLVNVSGTSVNWSGVGFHLPDGASCRGGTSAFCSHVLYNFYEATTLTLSGIGVQGSVLAPYARLSGSGGIVDGQVFVDSLTGSIEFHPYLFSGCLGY